MTLMHAWFDQTQILKLFQNTGHMKNKNNNNNFFGLQCKKSSMKCRNQVLFLTLLLILETALSFLFFDFFSIGLGCPENKNNAPKPSQK